MPLRNVFKILTKLLVYIVAAKNWDILYLFKSSRNVVEEKHVNCNITAFYLSLMIGLG